MPAWWLARRTPARTGPGDTPAVCASKQLAAQVLLIVCNCFDHAYCVGALQLLFMRVRLRCTLPRDTHHAIHLWLPNAVLLMQDPYVYVDVSRVALVGGLVAATSASHQLSNLLAVQGTTLVLQAERVGRWVSVSADAVASGDAGEWQPGVCYGRGEVVTHKGRVFRAAATTNESEPGDWSCAFLEVRALVLLNQRRRCGVDMGRVLVV